MAGTFFWPLLYTLPFDPLTGLWLPPAPEHLERVLAAAAAAGDAPAALVVLDPTYQGLAAPLAALVERNSEPGSLGAWLWGYIPGFSKLNLIGRYTDGIPALPWSDWLSAIAYGVVWVALFLLLSMAIFRRRAL